MKKFKLNGFTLLESLIALFCSILLSGLIVLYMQTCIHVYQDFDPMQNEFAIIQLRELLLCCSSIDVDGDALHCIYKHKEIIIQFDKTRLVRKPGYEIFMDDLEDGYFKEENGHVYIHFEQKNKTYQYQLS